MNKFFAKRLQSAWSSLDRNKPKLPNFDEIRIIVIFKNRNQDKIRFEFFGNNERFNPITWIKISTFATSAATIHGIIANPFEFSISNQILTFYGKNFYSLIEQTGKYIWIINSY